MSEIIKLNEQLAVASEKMSSEVDKIIKEALDKVSLLVDPMDTLSSEVTLKGLERGRMVRNALKGLQPMEGMVGVMPSMPTRLQ